LVSRDDVVAKDNTVVFNLKFPAPWGAIANYISLLAIVDADEVMTHATADDKFGAKWMERNPTPSGAYKLDKWVPGEQLVVSARPDFWAGKPAIDKIIFQIIPDASVRFSLLKKGKVDMVSVLDFKDMDALKDDPNLAVDAWVGNNWTHLGLNWNVKDDILKTVYYGFAVPAKTPFGSRVIGADPSTWHYSYDLDAAKKYLSQSAFPNGFQVTFSIQNNEVSLQKASQLIAESLGKIGIKVSIEQMTAAQNSDALVAKKLQMSITDFTSFVPDAGYHALWNHLPDSYANYFDYKNPEQEKIGREMLYMDPKDPKRADLLKQYQKIMADDVFSVYFASVKSVVVHKKALTGFAYFPDYPLGMRFDNLKLG
jgi:peptide/nickel transport system substrate-binding protein